MFITERNGMGPMLTVNDSLVYLPRWAKDEGIENCEGSWWNIQKAWFLKHLNSLLR